MAIYSIPVKDGQTGEIIYVRIEAKNNQEAEQIARNIEGYCGAYIEEIVEHAVETKNVEGKGEDIKIEDLERVIKNMDSLKSILNEQIEKLMDSLKNILNEQIEKLNVYKQNKIILEKNTIKNMEKIGTFEDMVVVNGGEYKPSFRRVKVKVIDLEVSKYPVTNNLWNRIMKNTSGDMLPVEMITYWEALEFCNKLSEKYGLKPVYKINNQSTKIIELDGKEVDPGKADFSKTEGFRLPTEVEWEWFARGGEVALQNNTFGYIYSGSNNIDEVAVYEGNTNKMKNVGTKKPNQLGLYDCSGSVWEWCYDTYDWREKIYIGNRFIYEEDEEYSNTNVLRGGTWNDGDYYCKVSFRYKHYADYTHPTIGFRVVRTL